MKEAIIPKTSVLFLLLVSVLPQSLLSFVGRDLMSLSFLTTRHTLKIYLYCLNSIYKWQNMVLPQPPFHSLSITWP